MPLFERDERGRRMFYRIDLDSRRITLQWGAFGGDGDFKILAFDTAAEALTEYQRHLDASTEAEGYRLVEHGPPPAPEPVPRRQLEVVDASELERMVAEDPFDDDRWSVLEDFLLLHERDPRAELIQWTRALNPLGAEQLRQSRLPLLLGRQHARITAGLFHGQKWRGGYLVDCRIARSVVGTCEALGASIGGRLLRRLTLAPDTSRFVTPACEAIARAANADALRELAIPIERGTTITSFDCTILSTLQLRSLDLRSSPLQIEHASSIESLERLAVPIFSDESLQRLVVGSLPRLNTLVLDLRAVDGALAVDAVVRPRWMRNLILAMAPITSGKFAPTLSELRIELEYEETASEVRKTLADPGRRFELIVTDRRG